MAENQFIGSIGSTFLGIRGAFNEGVVTWNNIYTRENQKYFDWDKRSG